MASVNDAAWNRLLSIKKALAPERIIPRALSTVLAEQKTRIFQRGEAADGSKISTSYSEGWERIREARGFVTAFVNLKFTGQLDADYRLLVLKSGRVWAYGVENRLNALKIQGAEETYGKDIFRLSPKEKRLLGETITDNVKRSIRRTVK